MMKAHWLCNMQITAIKVFEKLHEKRDWGTPEWNENQNLYILKNQWFWFFKARFWLSKYKVLIFNYKVLIFWWEKNQNQNKTLTFKFIQVLSKTISTDPKQFGLVQNCVSTKINPPFCVSSPDDSLKNHGSRLVYDVQLFEQPFKMTIILGS